MRLPPHQLRDVPPPAGRLLDGRCRSRRRCRCAVAALRSRGGGDGDGGRRRFRGAAVCAPWRGRLRRRVRRLPQEKAARRAAAEDARAGEELEEVLACRLPSSPCRPNTPRRPNTRAQDTAMTTVPRGLRQKTQELRWGPKRTARRTEEVPRRRNPRRARASSTMTRTLGGLPAEGSHGSTHGAHDWHPRRTQPATSTRERGCARAARAGASCNKHNPTTRTAHTLSLPKPPAPSRRLSTGLRTHASHAHTPPQSARGSG